MKQQAIGSLLKVITLSSIIFLSACSASKTGPTAKNIIVHNNHERIESSYHMAWKIYEDLKWDLPDSSTRQHNNAIMVALTQAQNGEEVRWYDSDHQAQGYTRIQYSHPISGGYCRLAETKVQYHTNKRTSLYKACTITSGATWNITLVD